MKEEIRLQNRDIELLIFLGKYKIISLDNTRYIYGTVTYQEKRIVNLVRHNYIKTALCVFTYLMRDSE